MRDRIIGNLLSAYLPPESIPEIVEHFDRARADGLSVCRAMPITFANGVPRWFRWTAVAGEQDRALIDHVQPPSPSGSGTRVVISVPTTLDRERQPAPLTPTRPSLCTRRGGGAGLG